MKAGREHRVPLSERAVRILSALPRKGARIFEGCTDPRVMLRLLQRMGRAGLTVHGFRATFKTWASETTAYPVQVVEQALAHTISNAVERAYGRGDLFDKRRKIMTAWADYCAN
jgi:integrase